MFGRRRVESHRVISLPKLANKYPLIFIGLPFFAATIGGAFLLMPLQQARFDHNDRALKASEDNAKLELGPKRRVVSIQEEYFRLQQSGTWDDYTMKRVERRPEDEPVFDQ